MKITYYTNDQMIENGFYYFDEMDEERPSVEAIEPDQLTDALTTAQIKRLLEWENQQKPIAVVGISVDPDSLDGALVLQDEEEAIYEVLKDGRVFLAGTNQPPVYDTFAELIAATG